MRYTWSMEEIDSCPQFGMGDDKMGWFYGIVRNGWRLHIVEVLPGFGYTKEYSLFDPRWLRYRMIRDDIRITPQRKARYVGVRSPEQQEADYARMQEEIKNARPIEELFEEFGFEPED